ncbi:eukaryotic translation initiation factor 2 subunit alpha [Phaffia rhodozyma]|uniref:Eukaryotic translation initiation factor 2 subunit alpha n=1 Tax=Phaffia rhodozyma TaxID=264483 RepID=A0A0F7SP08_PHARH|nr:eukaryotic translation initiation factor 2 subunit alpha [Phaffia rhodozyma]
MRFYVDKYPEVDDLVMVQVKQIAEMGAYVKLLEYDGIEGMILLSELSRRRIRSIQKLIRVGRNEVVVVLRVDKEKGYIDLSKRRVSAEDVEKCEEKFEKGKLVNSVLTHVAGKLEMEVETLYAECGWPLGSKFGHTYDAFKLSITEPEKVFEGINLPAATLETLRENIARRLTPKPVKIRSDIEVKCFAYEGIDAIKAALKAGEALSTESIPIKIRLVAPPLYVVTTNSTDKSGGVELMEKALQVIDEKITEAGGEMSVKMKPKAVSEAEDQELAALMAKVERENTEVSGDEGDSEEDE